MAGWSGCWIRRCIRFAVHVQRQPGAFSTLDAHISAQKISGIERGTAWFLRRAECIGPHAAEWSQSMLNSRGIEGVRVLMGLLSLVNRLTAGCRCGLGGSHGLIQD